MTEINNFKKFILNPATIAATKTALSQVSDVPWFHGTLNAFSLSLMCL